MLKKLGWLASIPAMILAQDARTVVANAGKALGADNLKTLQYSGMGSNAGIGQNVNPKAAWPLTRVKAYQRELDFNALASHVQMIRVQSGVDQDLNQYVLADSPWDDQYEFWLTPFGFLKGASANTATVRSETIDGERYSVVTFALQNKRKVSGYINDQNLVEKVQTWIDNDVLGDMLVEASYSVYKDFGGVKFPTMIIEKQGGFPVLIVSVSDVKPNAAVNIQPPLPHTGAVTPATVSVQSERITDGVFYLRGGTHHSVAVEFADHVAVIEAPLNEQRSLAVIAEVKKLIPNKPIRYVINTHHHFDHSGGLRAYVDEGATIVTQDINKEFYEKAFSTPRTINPDRLAQSGKIAKIETVGDKKVLTDGARSLELHLIKSSPHNDGILMAFLPKEKILVEVDVFTPPNPPAAGAPASAPTAAVNPSTLNLVDNVEKLKLDFVTILPLHGSGAATRPDLYAAIRKPVPDINQILTAAPPAAPGRGRGGTGGAAAGRGAQASTAPAAAAADPARSILEGACTSCHTLNRIQSQKLSKPEWQGIVDKMKGRGAEVSDDDTIVLVDYLAKTYAAK